MSFSKLITKAVPISNNNTWDPEAKYDYRNFNSWKFADDGYPGMNQLAQFLYKNGFLMGKIQRKCAHGCDAFSEEDQCKKEGVPHSDYCPVSKANFTMFAGGNFQIDTPELWKIWSKLFSEIWRKKVEYGKLTNYETFNPIINYRWDTMNERILNDKPFAFYVDYDSVMENLRLSNEQMIKIAQETSTILSELCTDMYETYGGHPNCKEYVLLVSQKQSKPGLWKNGMHINFVFW
jgi:hypothetical protein